MPDWLNASGAGRVSEVGESFVIGNGGGVLVTCGSANTKGNWAVVSAATPFDAHGIVATFAAKSAAGDQLLDIGIGSAGVEHVIAPDLLWTGGSSSGYNKTMWIPVTIPKGARLVCRSQSIAGATTGRVSVCLMQAGMLGLPALGKIIAMGADTSATGGVSLGNPAGSNTWGAWTEIIASVAKPLKWIMAVFGDQGITSRTSGQRYFGQMGRGSGGNEKPIGPEVTWSSSSTCFSINQWVGLWTDIPDGERLVARYGASGTGTPGVDSVIYGGW